MRCNKCGNENVQGGKFCIHCGNDMSVNTEINTNNQSTTNTVNSNVSNQVKKVSKTGTIVLLIFSIIFFNIIGIILSIIALTMLGAASTMPDGVERNSKLKSAKTCKIIALVLCILQAIVSIVTLVITIVSFGGFFNAVKDSIENGDIEFVEDNDSSYEDDEEEPQVSNKNALECAIDSDVLGNVVYTANFSNGKIVSLSAKAAYDISDYTDDYVKANMDSLGCDDVETTCTINRQTDELEMVATLTGSDLSSFLIDEGYNSSITITQMETLLESNGALCK